MNKESQRIKYRGATYVRVAEKPPPERLAQVLQNYINNHADFRHLRAEVNKEVRYRPPGGANDTVQRAPVSIYFPTIDDAEALGRNGNHRLRSQLIRLSKQAGYRPEYFGSQHIVFL